MAAKSVLPHLWCRYQGLDMGQLIGVIRHALPSAPLLVLEGADEAAEGIVLRVHARKKPRCPACVGSAVSYHSQYRRRLRDLPWQGRRVQIELRVRRFRCRNRQCPRRIFSEQIVGMAGWRARETSRVSQLFRWVGYALGGRAAERLLHRMALPTSDNTVLSRLKANSGLDHADLKVRVLGVDDWAWRKREQYGTILMDLEKRQVVDLLPARSVSSFADWLRSHPGVKMITRDRSLLYADGGRQGAPDAEQITDRYHLIDNLIDAVGDDVQQLQRQAKHDWAKGRRPSKPWTESRRLRFRQARYERYLAVVECRRHGQTIQAIATKLNLSYDTVSLFVHAPEFPERRIRCTRLRDQMATGAAPPAPRNFLPPPGAPL